MTTKNISHRENITLTVPSNSRFLSLIRALVESLLKEAGFSEKEGGRIVLALDEACANIMEHSYKKTPTETIDITFGISSSELFVEMHDYGPDGEEFDIKGKHVGRAGTEGEKITPRGRGMNIIENVMDTVEYKSSPEKGNILLMSKKIS